MLVAEVEVLIAVGKRNHAMGSCESTSRRLKRFDMERGRSNGERELDACVGMVGRKPLAVFVHETADKLEVLTEALSCAASAAGRVAEDPAGFGDSRR